MSNPNTEIIKALGLTGDAARDIGHLDIPLEPSELPSVQIKRLVFNTETIGRVFETMELLPKGEYARMKGEAAVLRGLLRDALGVLETISDDDMETDDRVMLSAIKNDISKAIAPTTPEEVLL